MCLWLVKIEKSVRNNFMVIFQDFFLVKGLLESFSLLIQFSLRAFLRPSDQH